MMVSRAFVILSSLALLTTVSSAHAQSIPPEGSLSISFTATQIPPANPMPIGGGREFVVLNMAMTASNDTGNPVLHNMGGRCQFARIINTSAKTLDNNTVFAPTPTMTAYTLNNATFSPALRTIVN